MTKILKMEKKLLVLSNATPPNGSEHENTLVNFKTRIPQNFLDSHKKWAMSVESFGCHFRPKNPIVPKNSAIPSLIQISMADFNKGIIRYNLQEMEDLTNLPRGMFLPHHLIFIDGSKKYTARQLVHHINSSIYDYCGERGANYKNVFRGVPVQYKNSTKTIEFGQFNYNKELNKLPSFTARKNQRTFVFIHKSFAKELMLVNEDLFKKANINGEEYLYVFNSYQLKEDEQYYPILSMRKEFPLKKPDLVQILSQNIRKTITNGTQLDVLKQFGIDHGRIGTYFQKSFAHQDFLELASDQITSLEFRITDENLDLLRLQPGFPSYLKLTFCPLQPSIMTKEYLRISSVATDLYPLNKASRFSVDIAKNLDYTYKKEPKIALASVTIENEWKLMPGLLLNAQLIVIESEIKSEKVYNFTCPRDDLGVRTCVDVCKWFEKQMKTATEMELKKVDKKYKMSFKTNCILLISRDLGQILGMPFMDMDLHNTSIHVEANTSRKKGGYKFNFYQEADESNLFKQKIMNYTQPDFFDRGNIALSGETDTVYLTPYAPRDIVLFPHLLFVYCNCVKPSPINDTYRQLLRIVPLMDEGNYDKKITVEFNQLEFVPLSELNIKLLKFDIMTHDNLPIEPLNENCVVYLNLLIKHE